MPSTYDSLLRLELQATGENQNTWGTKTNTNLELVAAAIAGHVSVDGTGSGDLTLTTSNGAADQARRAFITISGTLTGVRNIIIPTASKTYYFRNNATGSGSIVVKTASGTGVTLPTSGVAAVVCDGTETYLLQDANKLPLTGGTLTGTLGITSNVSIGGNVSVSGTGTFGGVVSVGGQATFAAGISVSAGAAIGGNLTASSLNVNGTANITGAAVVGGTLGLASTVSITGATQLRAGFTHNDSGAYSQATAFGAADPASIAGIACFNAFNYVLGVGAYIPQSSNVIRIRSLSDGTGPYLEYIDSSANAYGCRSFVSDVELKTNVQDARGRSLDYVMSIRLREFDWAPDSGFTGHVNVGFVAQELEAVDSQFVSKLGDFLHLNIDALLARAIGAIQEQQAEISELRARIEALECKTKS